MAKKRKKTGRPLKKISDREVMNLASVGCSDSEIAAMLDCGTTTITKRFRAPLKRGRNMARASLRRAQFKAALGGNPTMLIWLGKQLLNQKQNPLGENMTEEAAPSMIEMAAAMDASIPPPPSDNGRNGNGSTKPRASLARPELP